MPRRSLPELAALDVVPDGVRIPPGVTVPLTPRVRSLLDTAEVRRLARVSQLGLVGLVYPGAVHTRLEHSLGVYRLALAFLARLDLDARFAATVGEADAAAFVAAALLHDVGHWPFCHPVEDMGLPEIPRHESLVRGLLVGGATGTVLEREWELDPARVARLIEGTATDPAGRILTSLLSGPVDVDKMDYLSRDSLHAGVPYGRHFDQDRLLASLCLDETGSALAITEKGRTAAELMVFARYVMFSEVYWHHAVRAATAMLQRAVWIVRGSLDVPRLVRADEASWIALVRDAAVGTPGERLVDGLFGTTRRLFKRVATWDSAHRPDLHRALAGRPYASMVAVSDRLTELVSARLGRALSAHDLLIDAPPAEKEIEFRLQVCDRPEGRRGGGTPCWRRLEDVSPVVRSLAHEQFDELVKRVRIFAAPEMVEAVAGCDGLDELVLAAAVD